MFYLVYTGSHWPVKSIERMDKFSCRPIIITTDKIEEARKFSRYSDAIRCKRYWESGESMYKLDPWGQVRQLFVIRECDA